MQLADKAINLDAKAKEELSAEVQKLTGVENPNSVFCRVNPTCNPVFQASQATDTQSSDFLRLSAFALQ